MLLDHGGLVAGFEQALFATELTFPTAMEFAPDGTLFVTEKRGQVRIVKDGQLLPSPFLSLATNTFWERGLGGIVLDPDFETNGFLYVYYTSADLVPVNRLSRFKASNENPHVADAASEWVLLDGIPATEGIHNGGGVHFGPDGMLYVGIGDAGVAPNAQSLASLSGKLLRIDPHAAAGLIPPDNPFVAQPGARGEIWAYGLRNPFTFAVQPQTGALYINDVGAQAWEEVNLAERGGNFGWPFCEGPCDRAGFINPIYAEPHGSRGAAIVGGVFYDGNQFPVEYQGDYFFGDFVTGEILRLPDGDGQQAASFAHVPPFVVDLDVGPDGGLYYLDSTAGSVYRISFVGDANRSPRAVASASPHYGGAPLTVSFSAAGSDDPDGDSLQHEWNFGDGSPTQAGLAVTHEYANRGQYQVTLTVSDGRGGSAQAGPLVVAVGETPPTGAIEVSRVEPGNHSTDHASLVAGLYQDLLGRVPNSDETGFWLDRLDQGAGFNQVVQEFWNSSEHRSRQITDYYMNLLNRVPGGRESAHWVSALQAHGDTDRIVIEFAASPEYSKLHVGNRSFVAALYDDLLGRPADQAGTEFWLASLRSGASRRSIAQRLLSTPERLSRVVNGLYRDFLDRSPGEAERNFWIDRLRQGATEGAIGTQFLAADEYRLNQVKRRAVTTPISQYRAGDTIAFRGAGVDPEDGALAASAMRWSVAFHHRDHVHPFLGPMEGSDAGEFVIPRTGETDSHVWYRVHLAVTDSAGLSHTSYQDILPETGAIEVNTSPAGLSFTLDGRQLTGTQAFDSVTGTVRTVAAPTLQETGDGAYVFESWSGAGTASLAFSTPPGSTSMTARYREIPAELRSSYYFVAALYEDLLGHPADLAGLEYWVGQLGGGLSRDQIASAFWTAPEHRGRQVDDLFLAHLGRLAGVEERRMLADRLVAGDGGDSVLLSVLTSSEYIGGFSAADRAAAFVNKLYHTLLGRAGGAAETAFWIGQLQHGTPFGDMARAILNSRERQLRVIDHLYGDLLHRAATDADHDYWLDQLRADAQGEQSLALALLAADEFVELQVP